MANATYRSVSDLPPPNLGSAVPSFSRSNATPGAGIALALFLISFATVYAPVAAGLARQWWNDPDYSHGLVCAPLALGLAYARRRTLAGTARAPEALGLAVALGSLLILVVGRLGAELFLTRVSLIGVLAGAVIFVLGWRHLRVLAFPFVLLLLSVPLPAIVVNQVTFPLQLVASASAETVLNAASIPVLRDGNVLVLPNATLQVAEACGGIRSLVALVAAAAIGARLADPRNGVRAAILLLAVPVAVLMNAVRVVATAAGSYWFDAGIAAGTAHDLMGLATFAFAVTVLGAAASAIRSFWPPQSMLSATS